MNESELLFTELLDCSRDKLYFNREYVITQREAHLLADTLKKRLKGWPIQYILGRQEFMGLELRLTPDVFIPRPETEILIEKAIQIAQGFHAGVKYVLDIGTGSGCIAISLAVILKDAKVSATDISNQALEIAKQNAILNNAEINFSQSNLFPDNKQRNNYDLVVSNPPYIPTSEINNLQPEVGYEPCIALDGGRDGLDFYRRIVQEAPAHLRRGGFLILEMGFGQYLSIKELFNSVEKFQIIEVVKDYNNIDRVIVARYG